VKPFAVSQTFAGGLADLEHLHTWLQSIGAEQSLDPTILLRIRQALAEAFSNAAEHAHQGRVGEPIWIQVSAAEPDGCIRIDVTDSGPGFQIPPPAVPSSEAERGRGFTILRALTDRMEYKENTLSLWLRD
jgi:serine/threonine-protein kinase RsbW